MMSEDFTPWLLEINASPGMAPSSIEKAKLCANVIEDTIKGMDFEGVGGEHPPLGAGGGGLAGM